jgi:hypothetical protein
MWTPKMVQALLLKMPRPIPNTKVTLNARAARQPSPRGVAANESSGYGKR